MLLCTTWFWFWLYLLFVLCSWQIYVIIDWATVALTKTVLCRNLTSSFGGSWLSTILTLSCAGSSRGLPLVACARSVMGSVSSVTHMCGLAHLFVCAMSAITGHFKAGVSYVEVLGSPMHTTVKSAHSRRKIGMAVQRLSIWGVPRQIFSMNVKNMVSRKDDGMQTLS